MKDLSEKQINKVAQIVKTILKETPYQVYLFGSRVKSTSQRSSDLDVLIKSERKIPLHLIALLKEQFEESSLPFRVDVVDYHDIDEAFKSLIEDSLVQIS